MMLKSRQEEVHEQRDCAKWEGVWNWNSKCCSRRWTDDIREWTGMTIVECIWTGEDTMAWRVVTSSSAASDLQQCWSTSLSKAVGCRYFLAGRHSYRCCCVTLLPFGQYTVISNWDTSAWTICPQLSHDNVKLNFLMTDLMLSHA